MSHVLVCLHGWGGSSESFTELREALKNTDVRIFTPDLPGFGEASDPPRPWTTDDYADWVEEYLQQEGLTDKKIYLLGHSHGGRIAIKLAVRGSVDIEHLFLCASAGIRHTRHLKRMLGLLLAKTGKIFLSVPGLKQLQPLGKKLLYKLVRVHDYEKANSVMRDTLMRVTQEDLRPMLSLIDIPTDIFWGTDDHMTPYSDGKLMNRLIPNSTLHTYEGIRHRVHREKAQEIALIIQKHLA